VEKPVASRPTLQRRKAFREAVPKPEPLKRKVARFFGFSLLQDVASKLAEYEARNAQLDTIAPLTPNRLRDRIEERSVYLAATKELMKGRFVGSDASQIDDFTKRVDEEQAHLNKVEGLLNQAHDRNISVTLPLQDLMRMVKWGVHDDAILLGVANGMDANTIIRTTRRYAELGIPFNEHTLPSQQFSEANRVGERKELGSGAMNTVWLNRYQCDLMGPVYEMVSKPESPDPAIPPEFMAQGIGCEPKLKKLSDGSLAYVPDEAAKKPANLPGRAVATYRVDQLLGLNLVPPTYFAEEGGTVMGRAPGTSPLAMGKVRMSLDIELAEWLEKKPEVLSEYATAQGYSEASIEGDGQLVLSRPNAQGANALIFRVVDFDDARLRNGLNDLQWLDALCGQLDRNPQNYFVDGDMNVHAIDNDLSFGAVTTQFGKDNCPPLPKVISNELRSALMRLDEQALRATLSHLLEPEEVEAAVERLHLIQAELAKGGGDAVQVISTPVEWLSKDASNRLGIVKPDADGKLSNDKVDMANGAGYLGRDRANVLDRRWLNQQETVPERRTPIFDPAEVRRHFEERRQAATAGA